MLARHQPEFVPPILELPDDQGGWLFTQASSPGGAEYESALCWGRCHAQAPFAGVWLDYTATP